MSDTLPLAAPERRILARAIEAGIPSGLGVSVALMGVLLGSAMLVRVGAVAFASLGPAIAIANAYLLVTRGQTLGKVWLGLKIVRPDGSLPGAVRGLLVRELAVGVLELIPVLGLLLMIVDGAMMLLTDRRRSLHDEMADTIVVDLNQRP